MTDNSERTPHGPGDGDVLPDDLDKTRTDGTAEPTPQRYLEKTSSDPSGTSGIDRTTTAPITSFGDSNDVPEQLRSSPDRSTRRYEVLDQVGKGATSRVYAMRDNSLERSIAVKFLSGRRKHREAVEQRFLREARVTASLQHPNVMPVYDIGVSASGDLFFAMKKIEGCSMGQAIRAARSGEEVPEDFRSIDDRVRVFLKVCDALEYAHDQGFLHLDIKPDNIMLGHYGEVLLLDWGSAVAAAHVPESGTKAMAGTPAYMSPEQARRERYDERSDICCLGATFFHALVLRHPLWEDDPERFWERKRTGSIDEPTDGERRRVPKALLGIALKALAPDPANRYQSAHAFATDLKRWQAGQAVSAVRESLLEKFLRWYRYNRRLFWVAGGLSTAVLAVAVLLFREKIQEMVTWRRYCAADFSDMTTADLRRNWKAVSSNDWRTLFDIDVGDSSRWFVDSGMLMGVAGQGCENIAWKHRIPGDIRVEWDVTPLDFDGNVNCFIGGDSRYGGYMFHLGGFGDPHLVRLNRLRAGIADEVRLEKPFRRGTTYRIRMEKEGRDVRLSIDGRRAIAYRDADALGGAGHQTFGFENVHGYRIRIDNVHIYYHPPPLKVSPLIAADEFYEVGDYAQAQLRYRELAEVYADKEAGRTAWFKYGRCLARTGHEDSALTELALFEQHNPRHELAPFASRERARILESRGDTAAAVEVLSDLASRFRGHPILRTAFMEMAAVRTSFLNGLTPTWVVDSGSDRGAERWVRRELARMAELGRLFGADLDDNEFMSRGVAELIEHCAMTLQQMRDQWPELVRARADAYNSRGALETLADSLVFGSTYRASALIALGEYRRVLDMPDLNEGQVARCLLALGRYQTVLDSLSAALPEYQTALALAGSYDEALSRHPDAPAQVLAEGLGRLPEMYNNPLLRGGQRAGLFINHLHWPDSARALHEVMRNKTVSEQAAELQAYLYYGREEEVVRLARGRTGMEPSAAEALRRLGRPDDVIRRFSRNRMLLSHALEDKGLLDSAVSVVPEHHLRIIYLLQLMGRHDELRERYPRRKPVLAMMDLEEGNYEKLLRECPDERPECAAALYHLGRGSEIPQRYPEITMANALVVRDSSGCLAALEQYPTERWPMAVCMNFEGRYREVVDLFPGQVFPRSCALVELGRWREAPIDTGFIRLSRSDGAAVMAMRALKEWDQGNHRLADSLLAAAWEWNVSFIESAARFERRLLSPILHATDGDTAFLRAACDSIMARYAERYSRMLWHEAAWLSGRQTDEEFLAQPVRIDARRRLQFLKAVRADTQGRTDEAYAGYQACHDMFRTRQLRGCPYPFYSMCGTAVMRRFLQRRMTALKG